MQAPLLGLILSPQPLPVHTNELAQTQTDRRNPESLLMGICSKQKARIPKLWDRAHGVVQFFREPFQ